MNRRNLSYQSTFLSIWRSYWVIYGFLFLLLLLLLLRFFFFFNVADPQIWNSLPQGENCRGGVTPKSCIRAIIILFEWKSALNFNPWAKFQTFRHLTPSTFRSILILVCHPMSRRRPYSKYSNCSLIDWKLTYSPSPFRMSLSVSPKTAFGVLFLIVVFCFILFSRLVVSFALVTDLFLGWCSPTKIIKLQNYDYPGSIR